MAEAQVLELMEKFGTLGVLVVFVVHYLKVLGPIIERNTTALGAVAAWMQAVNKED